MLLPHIRSLLLTGDAIKIKIQCEHLVILQTYFEREC